MTHWRIKGVPHRQPTPKHGKPVMKRPPLPNGHLETITIQPSEPASGSNPALEAPKIERKVKLEAGPNASDDAFDVRVSLPARDRALRVLDALLKALAARGYVLSPQGVTIENQFIPIGIIEKEDKKARILTESEKKRRYPYGSEHFPTWDYFPNGKLSIFATAYVWWRPDLRKRWSDDRSSLDDKLNDVVIGLIALAIAKRDREDELRREKEEKEELERQRVERLRQANMEKARRDNLVSSIKGRKAYEHL
jgi:hypothetical protein